MKASAQTTEQGRHNRATQQNKWAAQRQPCNTAWLATPNWHTRGPTPPSQALPSPSPRPPHPPLAFPCTLHRSSLWPPTCFLDAYAELGLLVLCLAAVPLKLGQSHVGAASCTIRTPALHGVVLRAEQPLLVSTHHLAVDRREAAVGQHGGQMRSTQAAARKLLPALHLLSCRQACLLNSPQHRPSSWPRCSGFSSCESAVGAGTPRKAGQGLRTAEKMCSLAGTVRHRLSDLYAIHEWRDTPNSGCAPRHFTEAGGLGRESGSGSGDRALEWDVRSAIQVWR